jgi:hypothetical protein
MKRPGKYYPSECGFIKSIFNFTVKFLDYIKFFESQQLEPTQNDVVWSYLGNWSGYLAEQPQKVSFGSGKPHRQHIHRGLAFYPDCDLF